MNLGNDISNDPIEEYKAYVSSTLRSTFDYSTWHQHQYGSDPTSGVDPKLTFIVSRDIESHK